MSASPSRLYLLYHEIRNIPTDYSYVVETSEFERHADFFAQAQHCQSPSLKPVITFDDGHISNYEFALPILAHRDLHATFFITVGWTGARPGYMGWEQLRTLHQNNQQIGAHGWSHTLLTHCDPNTLDTELRTARLALEDKLGAPITKMSLPGGRFNRRVLEACREAGYTEVYTSIPRAEPAPAPALVGRLNIRNSQDIDWLARVLDPRTGTLEALARQDRWKTALKHSLGDRLYARLWAVLNREETASDPHESPAR